ncbi:MAG TPA: SDR family NAD(P)-dependent oxidoreductase, partial [Solirubrobacterales bacterium]
MGVVTYDFNGDVVLITGAARGLGRDMALGFARSGAKVAVSDLGDRTPDAVPYPTGSKSDLEETAAAIEELGAESLTIPADVTDEGEVEAMIAAVIERFGRLDVMVCNAGVISGGRVWELTEAQWDAVVDVDLKGPFLCSKHAARHMIDREGP